METLIEKINKDREIGFWDFKNTHSVGIHKIVNYPATMVPNMQNELIKNILEYDGDINNVLDPFHGSGVTLVESKSLGIQPYGIDINPLAHLITRVKLEGINKNALKRSLEKVRKQIEDHDFSFEIHSFSNINKWFRKDIIEDLSKLRKIIGDEKVANIRRYYWLCLINIIKKYSNTRSTTFKLHVKLEEDISKLENNIFKDFLEIINESHRYLPNYSKENKFQIKLGDSLEILKQYEEEFFDLICTSPPYGDNATTVTYGQYSMLPIYWINNKDMDIRRKEEKLIQNFSSIDSLSLGGGKSIKELVPPKIILNYLNTINESKRGKVIKFFADYENSLKELIRVLKRNKYIVITLGNRRVDNKLVPMVEFTKEFLRKKGFEIIGDLQREISMKRMPKRVSRVKNKAVDSMNHEHVLIAKKLR
jgi:DNA modification methylase